MISLDDASKEISYIIEKYISELKLKYNSVEHYGASLKCVNKNRDFIKLQAIPDYSRSHLNIPKDSREYQLQGGHKKLAEKLAIYNKDAWKIEVKKTSSNVSFEIAFYGSENSWDINEFENNFINLFLKNI
jgi:hypothetical protein